MNIEPQCASCRHLRSADVPSCDAFPGGIPDDLIEDRRDHREPYPGDGGIRYEPEPESPLRKVRDAPTEPG